MKEQVTIDEVIELFNELIEIDNPAFGALVANRVPCNEELANHPTVQVGVQNGGYRVGLIGIVNGMFGVDENGYGPIALNFEDSNLVKVERFKKVERSE